MAKLISETVKLISADPKSHLLGNFRRFLYDLHQTRTQNVQKSHNIGKILSKKEKMLLSKENPWGVILFRRNIYSLKQTQRLIHQIKKYSKSKL